MNKDKYETFENPPEAKPDNPKIPDLRLLHLGRGAEFRCQCGNNKFELGISEDAVFATCSTVNCRKAFLVIANKEV